MKVKFIPNDIELEIREDQTVMELARESNIKIKSVCNGMPSCAECRVKIVEGEYNVLPPSAKELSLIGTGYYIDQRRLSCQLKCFGDITVDLSEQVHKQDDAEFKRPQGSLRKDDHEESYAVTGNIIEQEQSLIEEVENQKATGKPERNFKNNRRRNKNRNKKYTK